MKQTINFPSAAVVFSYTVTQKVAKNMESRPVLTELQLLAIRTMDVKPVGHRNLESGSRI